MSAVRSVPAAVAILLTAALAGCSSIPTAPPTSVQGTAVTSPNSGHTTTTTTTTTTPQRADWDLSSPRTPAELGGRSADVVSAETLGRNGVDVRITLPGGDAVSGAFGLVTGDSGGGGGPVRHLSLATTHLHDDGWEPYVEAFVEQFGGDQGAIRAYLDSALTAVDAGQVDPGRYFAGDARPRLSTGAADPAERGRRRRRVAVHPELSPPGSSRTQGTAPRE